MAGRILVIVLGDLARSPRMLRHAAAAKHHGWTVDLLGYRGRDRLPETLRDVVIRSIPAFDDVRGSCSTALPFAFVRLTLLAWSLAMRLITVPRPNVILLQVPPAFPALPVVALFAKIRRIPLVIDWHNTTASMVAQRYGSGVVARWVGTLERRLSAFASAHLAVSASLATHCGHECTIVRDSATEAFCRSARFVGFDVATGVHRNPTLSSRTNDAPPLVVMPSSWSLDDDFGLLVAALRLIDARLVDNEKLVIALTGEGERRVDVERELLALQLRRVAIVITGWLQERDFLDLLGSADAGLSLHRSASGLDLPIKLSEMMACRLPVVVLDYGPVLREVLDERATFVQSADQLAAALLAIARRDAVLMKPTSPLPSWEREWERLVAPLLSRVQR